MIKAIPTNLIKTNINEALSKVEIVIRDGTPLSKGVSLTEPYLESIEDLLKKYINYFIQYPDMFLDMIKPQDTYFNLFFYQRIVLRALMKYKEVYVTACRAFSKSFITILGLILQCIFTPRSKRFICAPNKNQSAQIAILRLIIVI